MPLNAAALSAAIELAQATTDGHQIALYLGSARGTLDESLIVGNWTPGAGWADVTGQVVLSAGIAVAHDGTAYSATFTVADESRTQFADDLAVAIIARHWFPTTLAWGAWHLVCGGYLDGSDTQKLGLTLNQTSQRTATYAGYWMRARVPALRLGRRNLATTATISASSPALAAPASEVPVEYVSQDNCAAQKLLDGNLDTVAIADVIADPAQPAIGDTTYPRFLRVYGPQQRGIAVGGEPRFAEVWFGHDETPWGTFANAGAVPYVGDGGGSSNVRNDNQVSSTIDTAGKRYIVRALAQPGSTTTSGIQWNLQMSNQNVPLKLKFGIKAGSTASVGRSAMVSYQIGSQGGTVTPPVLAAIILTDTVQPIEIDIGSTSKNTLIVVRFQSGRGEVFSQDLYFEISDLHVWSGYDDLQHATDNDYEKLFLCWDNGAGVQRNQRIAFGLINGEQWTIPPLGSVIFCDDVNTFKAKFNGNGSTLFEMKKDNAAWFFAPGIGRLKLAYANNPSLTNYDDPQLQLVEEIDFAVANGGVPWLPTQALSRNTPPVGTSTMTAESFPHLGLLPGAYGAAYWWLDLGAYAAPKTTMPIGAADLVIGVDNIDAYTAQGFATIDGGERVWWIAKTADALVINTGGRGMFGTTAAIHAAGAAVVPDGWGGNLQNNGTKQTGWNIDTIEIRRKPGTPQILQGAVITSNLLGPSDPSTSGGKWENNPDWRLVQRFTSRQGNPDVITMALPEGIREARHVALVIDQMARFNGQPQRAKVNEIVVREATIGGSQAGLWQGLAVSDIGGAVGVLLHTYAGMPPNKISLATGPDGYTPITTALIGDTPIAPTTAAQAIQTIAASGQLTVRLDETNSATIAALPENPEYAALTPDWTLTKDTMLGDVTVTWVSAHAVAQVKVTAKEPSSLRTYAASYPGRPAWLGAVIDLKGVIVRTSGDVYRVAEAAYRKGNARRKATVIMGAVPWLQPGQRLLLVLAELDTGGNDIGINFTVDSFSIAIGIDSGGVTWRTTLTLSELPL